MIIMNQPLLRLLSSQTTLSQKKISASSFSRCLIASAHIRDAVLQEVFVSMAGLPHPLQTNLLGLLLPFRRTGSGRSQQSSVPIHLIKVGGRITAATQVPSNSWQS